MALPIELQKYQISKIPNMYLFNLCCFSIKSSLEDDFYVSMLHSQQFQLVDDLYLFIINC